MSTEWMTDGLCNQSDPELWFATNPPDVKKAVKICMECPVRLLCASYAIKNEEEYGVWGGLTEIDRKQLRAKKPSRAGIGNKRA